jgi:YceI-like domain
MKVRFIIPLIIIHFIAFQAKSQLFITQAGETSFFSETPLENISALNKQVAAIINTSTSEVAVRIQNVAFHFPNKLMEEHFNENYIESEKYPHSTFKGKFQEVIDFKKEGVYDVSAKGILEMHGVKQERVIKGKLTVGKDQLTFIGNFDVKLIDHKIVIPTLVMTKIAESLTVKNRFVFTQKK